MQLIAARPHLEDARGCRQPPYASDPCTLLSYRQKATASRSGLITTSPLSALTACCRLTRTASNRQLYLEREKPRKWVHRK
jgi:hypothetical protein